MFSIRGPTVSFKGIRPSPPPRLRRSSNSVNSRPIAHAMTMGNQSRRLSIALHTCATRRPRLYISAATREPQFYRTPSPSAAGRGRTYFRRLCACIFYAAVATIAHAARWKYPPPLHTADARRTAQSGAAAWGGHVDHVTVVERRAGARRTPAGRPARPPSQTYKNINYA